MTENRRPCSHTARLARDVLLRSLCQARLERAHRPSHYGGVNFFGRMTVIGEVATSCRDDPCRPLRALSHAPSLPYFTPTRLFHRGKPANVPMLNRVRFPNRALPSHISSVLVTLGIHQRDFPRRRPLRMGFGASEESLNKLCLGSTFSTTPAQP